jgi:hypothetical protein
MSAEDLRRKYQAAPGADVSRIEDVDFVGAWVLHGLAAAEEVTQAPSTSDKARTGDGSGFVRCWALQSQHNAY